MMKFSEHRLWLARLEKPDYQRTAISAICDTQPSRWLIQPTLTKKSPGLVRNAAQLETRLSSPPDSVQASLSLWRRLDLLPSWSAPDNPLRK